MIQVLKEGKMPRYKDTCDVCGCEFICDRVDTWEALITGFLKVNCPCCGMPVTIIEEEARVKNDGTD